MSRYGAIVTVTCAGVFLAGCGIGPTRSVSLADRCGAAMKAAMPFAKIDISSRTSQNTGIDTIVAHVQGVRTDLPAGSLLPRRVAAQCDFDDNALRVFRLTEGVPPH